MKVSLSTQILVGFAITLGAIATLSKPSYAQSKFFCDNEQLVTIVRTRRGEIPIIRWLSQSFPPPWTAVERCKQVSARFEQFNNNGTLKYIKAAHMNNQPVLCVAGYKGGACLPNGLLVTFKSGTDPNLTLKRLLDRRAWATGQTINLSGGKSDREFIFEVNGETYFDMESWLEQ
ncbi:MAG: COP23 domain-containing protein [Xenococcaceae cyanobacterium MO_188.B32]|nr:COP23 domain-containing protein [Xenococcaceae cyanobacterium MO_188.B32]